jgi:hypothetical protein
MFASSFLSGLHGSALMWWESQARRSSASSHREYESGTYTKTQCNVQRLAPIIFGLTRSHSGIIEMMCVVNGFIDASKGKSNRDAHSDGYHILKLRKLQAA